MDCYHHPCSSPEHEISHRAHCCWTAAPVLVLQGSLCYHIPFKQREVSLFVSPVLTYCSLLSGSASPTCVPRPLPDAVQEYSLPAQKKKKTLFWETFANTGLSNAVCPCLPVYPQHQFVDPGVKWSRELTQAKNNLTN